VFYQRRGVRRGQGEKETGKTDSERKRKTLMVSGGTEIASKRTTNLEERYRSQKIFTPFSVHSMKLVVRGLQCRLFRASRVEKRRKGQDRPEKMETKGRQVRYNPPKNLTTDPLRGGTPDKGPEKKNARIKIQEHCKRSLLRPLKHPLFY